MIKITIDGEEVYSAKDFTIKEEMLNTPSVILNNVYPISWEQDRDYISRFYHPNDYSKCLIMNNTHIPEEPGITVTSTSINADVDTSKKYEYALMGDTKQNGTPTPSSPIPIETVTGGQTISVTGKNLWGDLPTFTRTNAGYTATQNEDGTITLSGTSTASGGSITFQQAVDNGIYKKIEAGTYTISCDMATNNIWIQAYDITNSSSSLAVVRSSTGASFTLTEEANVFIRIWISTSGIVTDGTYKIQLEKGSKTSYEPYKSQTYEINLGKNLFDSDILIPNMITGSPRPSAFSYNSSTKELTMTNYSTDSYIPTIYNNANYIEGINIKVKTNTTYTLSFNANQPDSTLKNCVMGLDKATNKYKYIATLQQKTLFTFNTGNYDTIAIRLGSTASVGTETIFSNIQLELGDKQTSFNPYKTPIELCKLSGVNTYTDYIRKGTGKNLFDESNVEVGTFYDTTDGHIISTNLWSQSNYISVNGEEKISVSSYYKEQNNSYEITQFDSSMQWIKGVQFSLNDSKTYTLDSNTKYIKLGFRNDRATTVNLQLEENNQPSIYEPYGYKDKWYIYKAIGKVVLDGSESCGLANNVFYIYNATILQTSNIKGAVSNYFSNAYSQPSTKNVNVYNADNSICLSASGTKRFYIKCTSIISTADFKTWLSTHNTIVYYALSTPTYEEITDTDLINQLESIELYNGTNNIIVSGYLPSPIQLHYNYVIEEDISDLLFCGVVKNSGYISLNPRHPHYQTLQILDFKTFLSEGETLDFVIANKTIEEAIEQVISTIAPYGFIKGNIQLLNSSDVIGAYSTKDKTAYDVFNYIADITQSRWTTRLIDENTVAIDFYDPTLLPQGSPINYTQNYFEQNLIDDVSYSYGSNDYRNKQVMTSSEVYGNILQTQTIVANGYQTQFDTELKIGKISSITINGVQMTFATTQEKELGYSADFYYTPGNNFFESADLRSTGQIIIISYLAIVEGRQIITNALEIDRVATSTGRKGVVARYEDRNDATTSTELQLIGQSYIKYKGVPEIKLNVTTRKNLWNIGDRVTFNAPITELATEYMVKKKEIQRVFANPSSEEVIFYKFELSSSFNMEQAINYFDNQRAKAKGNIGEGEYITRNVDIENISNVIFYDGTCEEITLVGDNTLNSILNSPFVN